MYELIYFIAFVYVLVAQILALYFWYLWSQCHGFWNTLFIGSFVSEFKGLLWPFFI